MANVHSPLRVAAIIPVYRARFLAEALQSVFAQSRPPDEVLVIDDGSPDQQELERTIATYRDRVVLLRQSNEGAGTARNRGIAAATAPLVALLDADDQWLPEFLAEQLAIFEAAPETDLVYSDGLVVGPARAVGETFMTTCPSEGPVTLESLLAQRCTVLLSSVVARRDAIVDTGGFDVTLRRGQDFDLWLRLARRGARMTYQRKALVLRRIHDDNLSGTALNEAERPLRVLEKVLRTMDLSTNERRTAEARLRVLCASLAREQGKELLKRGDFAAARRSLAQACRGIPGWKLRAALLGLHVAPQLVRRVYLSRLAAAPVRGAAGVRPDACRVPR